MTTVTTVHPAPVGIPRGSVWAAQAALALGDAWRRLFTLRTQAPRTRSQEAEALRAYALSIRQSDPGFAADLYAAADRHETRG